MTTLLPARSTSPQWRPCRIPSGRTNCFTSVSSSYTILCLFSRPCWVSRPRQLLHQRCLRPVLTLWGAVDCAIKVQVAGARVTVTLAKATGCSCPSWL